MGMTGTYIAIENFLLSQIIKGEKSILEIDPTQCCPLDVDKSWRAIHYLLCKDIENGKPPMGYVVPIRDDNELDCELEFGAFYYTLFLSNPYKYRIYSPVYKIIRDFRMEWKME